MDDARLVCEVAVEVQADAIRKGRDADEALARETARQKAIIEAGTRPTDGD
jgi:hypothetical protein